MNESRLNFFQNLKFMINESDELIRNQMFFDFLMKVLPESSVKHENGIVNMENDTLTALRAFFGKHVSLVLQNKCDKCSVKREIPLMFVSAISMTEKLKEMKKLMMKTSERTSLICGGCKKTMNKSVEFGKMVFVNTYRDNKFIELTLQNVPLSFHHNRSVYELKGLIHASQRHFSCYAKEKEGRFWYLDDDGTQRLVEDESEKVNPEVLIYVKQLED